MAKLISRGKSTFSFKLSKFWFILGKRNKQTDLRKLSHAFPVHFPKTVLRYFVKKCISCLKLTFQ